MISDNASSPLDAAVTGTPRDYSEDLYRFYIEIADVAAAEQVLRNFLGPERAKRLRQLEYGFEFVTPIQCVPDIIRLLAQENIAVYQVVRQGRAEGTWR